MECYDKKDPQSLGVGDTWSYFNQLYWNGYVDQSDYEDWRTNNCDSESHRRGVPHPACDLILNRVSQPSNLGPDFNPDDSFDDYCTGNRSLDLSTSICTNDSSSTWSRMNSYLAQASTSTAFGSPVIYNSLQEYFNFTQDAIGMLKYYKYVLSRKPSVRILIYSGLSDIYTVPFSYTMPCIYQLVFQMGAKVTIPWKLWKVNVNHVGHWKQWSNHVTYATIRGAGHEVPLYQPYSAMVMFDRFLHNDGLDPLVVQKKLGKYF
eukprot:TRINITY_DN11439_c0_g1_i7.p1 TRINITY_DN11439_c0_g1~~TRINITY_DN11439_c0_g1_i7.p1  ORF type:complete len:297 (-),score=45.89 TRINITY_DN11439_c0_g1_i7:119-904(-)